jgi:hypothetical protein
MSEEVLWTIGSHDERGADLIDTYETPLLLGQDRTETVAIALPAMPFGHLHIPFHLTDGAGPALAANGAHPPHPGHAPCRRDALVAAAWQTVPGTPCCPDMTSQHGRRSNRRG